MASSDPNANRCNVPIPSYSQQLVQNGVNSKAWYFFFQSLYQKFQNAILGPSGVTPGAYTNANITVNEEGLITLASNGSGGGGGITDITSTGGTVTITNPTGPTVNLEV